MTGINTRDSGLVVKLFGTEPGYRINRGVKLSIKVLKDKKFCEVIGFKNKYELRNFENRFNNILIYDDNLCDKNYKRDIDEIRLNYKIKEIK